MAIMLGLSLGCVSLDGPIPNIVTTDFHAVDSYSPIAALMEILLHHFVGTIGIAD